MTISIGVDEPRQQLVKKKQVLDQNRPGVTTISAIPAERMDAYVAEMRHRLTTK